MLHSLSAQAGYYSKMITQHPGWQFAGVYADEAMTGTKENRLGFQNLLKDCRNGKIDLVIVKSISRLARNTVTLLETVRELKSLGVDVFFEEQNIHTLSSEGELMLTILAGYAQEESLSASENQKWRIKKCYEEGRPWSMNMLGYRQINGSHAVVPEEAEAVRRIYRYYLSGMGMQAVARRINADGFRTRSGREFRYSNIDSILKNETYTGNLMLQRKYRIDHISKREVRNRGARPMYCVNNSHEAIVSADEFKRVQETMRKRAEKYGPKPADSCQDSPFKGKILCGICGRRYVRKKTPSGPVWICPSFNKLGKSACASKRIPESVLESITADTDMCKVEYLSANNGNLIVFHFSNGTSLEKTWKDRSRSELWTGDMRRQAAERMKERNRKWKETSR